MNGIFGGFLSIIDSIGGGILYILIGEAASRMGALTRLVRLVFGAVLFGGVISLFIYLNSPEYAFQKLAFQNSPFLNDNSVPLIFVPPVATLLATALLELLSFAIEYKPARKAETHKLRITPVEETESH
ncbi:MAG TPA: hypothetical protein VHQ01_12405 [Pyrinomonadaceae bacterium]|nr:hypothetical protein [Pyrinomonadaceae bacterium]